MINSYNQYIHLSLNNKPKEEQKKKNLNDSFIANFIISISQYIHTDTLVSIVTHGGYLIS
jgi:hypothetical protein